MNSYEPGIEVASNSGLETIRPANVHLEDKHHEDLQTPKSAKRNLRAQKFTEKNLPNTPDGFNNRRLICGLAPIVWILAIIAIVSFATALGVGLGEGLAAQRRSPTSAYVIRHLAANLPRSL